MNRCQSCRHWKEPEADYPVPSLTLGRCARTLQAYDATEWVEDEQGDVVRALRPSARGTTAVVKDASDYSATLYTLAEHGCTMWEGAPA